MIIALFASLSLAASAQVIPTSYEAGHFYATPHTTAGQSLRLLVDTGGGGTAGMYWITAAASRRLNSPLQHCSVDGQLLSVATVPGYASGAGLPSSIGPCQGRLMVLPDDYPEDGQLGASYLGTRVWTFDYPRHQLRVEDDHWRPERSAHPLSLGFLHDGRGNVLQYFPRIVVLVDGQPLDTGASAYPTTQAKAVAGTATVAGVGVTSYITSSTLERWHKAHPDWPVVQDGDELMAPRFVARLIRVPRVEIGGWSVGPVWFTERPDQDFHATLDSIMDGPPAGAIGANVLDHFTLNLDYPHATAWLSCTGDCIAATQHVDASK